MDLAGVRFDLRDRHPAVVEAWAAHFAGVDQVRVQPGDIFQDEADALVSPANSFGVMDGGIDLAFSEQFGWDLQARVQVPPAGTITGSCWSVRRSSCRHWTRCGRT